MRLVRVPLRISLIGGGSDLPSHYEEYGGAVVSATINKYIYITAKPNVSLFPHRYRLAYANPESCVNRDEIKHPIIKQLVNDYGLGSLDLSVLSDIPAGTGLGSSSAFTVGMHAALSGIRNSHVLAQLACETEIKDLREPIGKQDQFAVAFGGLNSLEFTRYETRVRPIVKDQYFMNKLQQATTLVYVGGTRSASKQLEKQSKDPMLLNNLADLANEAYCLLQENRIYEIGPIIKEGWEIKKRLSTQEANKDVDRVIERAFANGATGAKLLGAGGTGFVCVFSPKPDTGKALQAEGFEVVPFEFEQEGVRVLYED